MPLGKMSGSLSRMTSRDGRWWTVQWLTGGPSSSDSDCPTLFSESMALGSGDGGEDHLVQCRGNAWKHVLFQREGVDNGCVERGARVR